MTTITVSTNAGNIKIGIEKVADNLPRITKRQIKSAMTEARKTARGNWPNGGGPGGYSIPQTSGTRYRRTGNYGRSMTIQEIGLSFKLSSTASRNGKTYAPFVGGNAYGTGQANIHAGRWPLLSKAVSDSIRDLVASIENDIENAGQAGKLSHEPYPTYYTDSLQVVTVKAS